MDVLAGGLADLREHVVEGRVLEVGEVQLRRMVEYTDAHPMVERLDRPLGEVGLK